MGIERYESTKHLATLAAWSAARGVSLTPELLPSIGFVVDDAAAAFLYRTDASVAFADYFVTNPAASLRARHHAWVTLIRALLFAAARLGCRRLVAYTPLRGAQTMLHRLGVRASSASCAQYIFAPLELLSEVPVEVEHGP